MVRGSEGLGGVFNHREIVFGCDGVDGRHVGRLTVDADGHDRLGSIRDGGFD